MMTKNKNIFQQEEEFLQLNAEIDSKTKDLMHEVDQIKKIQLSNDNVYSNWSFSEPFTQIEAIERGKESPNELAATVKTPEDNFTLNDCLFGIKESTSIPEAENSKENKIKNDLKKYRIGRNLSHSAKLVPSLVTAQIQEHTLGLGITKHKSDGKLNQGKLENDVIPEILKGVGQEGIMKFLSAKVKLLTEQLELLQKDEKKHVEKIKELQSHKDKLVEEREKLLQQVNTAKNTLIKFEKHTKNLADELQIAQNENCHLKKELETLKKEMQQHIKNHNAKEIKLNRTLAEVDKLKATFQLMKQEEKEFKDAHRKKIENLTASVKTLDRQRLELLNGFKKQLLVIDNLKRQKDLIEAGKLLKSAENDFVNYLECNPPGTARHTSAIKSAKS